MAECPFCNDLLGPNDFLPGQGAICPRCGNRIATPVWTRPPVPPLPPASALPSPAPAPRKNQDREPPVAIDRESDDEDAVEPRRSLVAQLRHLDGGTLAALVVGSLALLVASLPALSF